jgi:DNA invertase Pin-like site-specific DNA recombinase
MTPAQRELARIAAARSAEMAARPPKATPKDSIPRVRQFLTEAKRAEIDRLRSEGASFQAIATAVDCDASSVHRHLTKSRSKS